MLSHRWFPQNLPGRAARVFVLPLLLMLPAPRALAWQWQAAPPPAIQESGGQPTSVPSVMTLNLQECLQLALQRQLDSSLGGVIQGMLVLSILIMQGLQARLARKGK